MDYTYNLKANPPHKIWWNTIAIVFDYSEFYFQLECNSEIADTQNKSDEAIVVEFTKHLEPFVVGTHTKLICQDKRIEELYIVRVFLYFTNYREYSKIEKFFNITKQRLKTLFTGKKDAFGDLFSKATGGSEEVTCHPNSDEAKNIDPKYSNLIDCGLLVQIDGKCLKAFVECNGFGFDVWEDKYFHNINELKEIVGQYEFIKV
jgi:hypothetical protein